MPQNHSSRVVIVVNFPCLSQLDPVNFQAKTMATYIPIELIYEKLSITNLFAVDRWKIEVLS